MDHPGETPLESFLLDSAERGRRPWRWLSPLVAVALALLLATGWYWSREPAMPPVLTGGVPGESSATMLEALAITLLEKRGGFIANDALPPGMLLDDMPAFEAGALVHIRDFTRAMRRDFARSEAQSIEDPDLARAEARLNFDSDSWLVPSTESEYAEGIARLDSYRLRLLAPQPEARFHARADNLARWLDDVSARLGGYSQRLAESVDRKSERRTPWLDIDDVFYESRGYCWALLAQLRAAQVDFAPVLADRNAAATLAQVIRDLESTQATVWSPMILNGREYGLLANHSLVLAGYVSRASTGILQLRQQLERG